MGERTPHLDALARGGWIGITSKHTRADLIRALLEGVSLQPEGLPRHHRSAGRSRSNPCASSGGGAKSPFWRQLLADIFDKRVVVLETQEGSAYGAALLALVGTGAYSSVPEVCRVAIREVESVAPRAESAAVYRHGHVIFQSLYPALMALYPRM